MRLAGHADRLIIEAIVNAAYAPYVLRIGRKPAPMLDNYLALIEARRVHLLEEEGVVRGLVVLIPEKDGMLLDNVAVSPEAQGKGFGRMLLEFAEQVALDAGSASIRLYTNEAMTENIALYSRIGYVETHRAVEKGLRRIYMSKRLRD